MRKLLHAISLITLAFLLWLTWGAVYGPNHLADRIPTHFGLNGQADAWGQPKMLLLFPVMAVFLYAMMTLVSRYPGAFNYPVRVTAQNRPRLQRIAQNMIAWLTAETVCLFAALQYFIVQAIRTEHNVLPPGVMIVAIVIIFFTIAIHIAAMRRAA
ncbi:MAG TPA: DUF1648 domain-containing protein [Acidobacteriaceae bacterium]|jgi:uncharacterized membrane protein|nr:DUF1648 domain-containing protein [Acidobacteriaceae bacterium]